MKNLVLLIVTALCTASSLIAAGRGLNKPTESKLSLEDQMDKYKQELDLFKKTKDSLSKIDYQQKAYDLHRDVFGFIVLTTESGAYKNIPLNKREAFIDSYVHSGLFTENQIPHYKDYFSYWKEDYNSSSKLSESKLPSQTSKLPRAINQGNLLEKK